jgi:hypothetical protein
MTDFIAYHPLGDIVDVITADKKCTSGYGNNGFYRNLQLALYSKDGVSSELYEKYGVNYKPITPLFLVRWSDE